MAPPGPKDDGTAARDIYKDLQLPTHIDEMLHEHCRFLVQQGMLRTSTIQEYKPAVFHTLGRNR